MDSYALYSTGSNSHGQLGLGTDQDRSTYARVQLPLACRPIHLAFGANHALLLADVGGRRALFGSGSDRAGQLGARGSGSRWQFDEIPWGQLCPRDAGLAGGDYDIIGVASTWETSFVHLRPKEREGDVRNRGSDLLISFGSNDWGERGVSGGGARIPIDPTVISMSHAFDGPSKIVRIVAGPRHVLALLESLDLTNPFRVLVGWGAARHGQLGSLGATGKLPRIVDRPEIIHLDAPFSPKDVVDFSCGKDHSAILVLPSASTSTAESTIVTLGSNKHGQLGPLFPAQTSQSPSAAPSKHNILPISEAYRNLSDSRRTSPVIDIIRTTWNSTFVSLPSILPHNSLPSIVSFGANSHGQLGVPDSVSALQVEAMQGPLRVLRFPSPHSTPALSSDPPSSQTSPPAPSSVRFSTGSEHVIAILDTQTPSSSSPARQARHQELWTWGWNEHGNLGLGDGDIDDRARPVRVGGVIQAQLDAGRGSTKIVDCWGGMATSWVLIRTSP
ncbi:hypothetical protein JCM11491_005363 [Sporobolomyces phaffii]